MSKGRLSIYGNWSAYDELSDGVLLTEDLAMRQFEELLRLRSLGVHFDAYLMDAFWYDPAGCYRTWRKPHWPNGPQRWLDACREHGLIPGLWFTANTLCQIQPVNEWLDSADENKWGLCCFYGGFLDDYLEVLDFWYGQGIRIFKIDFADFGAAPPVIKVQMPAEEIRERNMEALRQGLARFKASHEDSIFMAFNGFESKEYMDRTDRPLEPVIDRRWLNVFDSIYSGDPRPADVPAVPFWRSVDIYGDHTTRALEQSGIPLPRIDNCGFMAGPTGTCYWRGKAMWKGMLVLTLARGGDLTVFYGDLSLFSDEDGQWMAIVQALFAKAFESGPARSIGGVPGKGEPYGWIVGERLMVVVNPQPVIGILPIPSANWQILFADSGFQPAVDEDSIALGPYQMALLALDGPNLGVQADCVSLPRRFVKHQVVDQSKGRLVVEVEPGDLRLIVQQRKANGNLVRSFAGTVSAASLLSIVTYQDGEQFPCLLHNDRIVWSGMSWAAADVVISGSPIRIEITSSDPEVDVLDLQIWGR